MIDYELRCSLGLRIKACCAGVLRSKMIRRSSRSTHQIARSSWKACHDTGSARLSRTRGKSAYRPSPSADNLRMALRSSDGKDAKRVFSSLSASHRQSECKTYRSKTPKPSKALQNSRVPRIQEKLPICELQVPAAPQHATS